MTSRVVRAPVRRRRISALCESPEVLTSVLKRSLMVLAIAAGVTATATADTYVYDTLGRLTRITYSTGGFIEYVYDLNGNRSIVRVSVDGSEPPAPITPLSKVIVLPLNGLIVIPLPE
jgi:YD repeat-containing protein